MGVKKKRIAQKRAAANSGGRRRLGQAEENAELKNDIARMEGKPVEDVKDSEVEEDKMGGEDEAFEEIAEAVGKVVEEDATLDTKDKKKAKFKELRTKLKSAIAEQKGVDASTIDDIDVRKAQKRAAKLKVKKKRIAQKRVAANSGGRRRLGQAEENAELKNDIARMEGKPVEDVKDSEVEEDKMG